MRNSDTIVALSSGGLPSGVAVIRLSGNAANEIMQIFAGRTLSPRKAELVQIRIPNESEPIDEGIMIWFPGPYSFTGEDCLEFQVHGSRAVVSDLISALCLKKHVRLAEAGEFSKRAFENGKMDLTQIEGLADLIVSETREQRLQAYRQQQGGLRGLYGGWRKKLIHLRALIEAELDFSDEEDVPDEIAEEGFKQLECLITEIEAHLSDNRVGEIIRDGFEIVLLGNPNSGKSSLLNAISKRDVAIVTDEPGTTRDMISIDINIDGYAVRITDTAGLRDSDNQIEIEGMRRAKETSENADLVIWLQAINDKDISNKPVLDNLVEFISKDDFLVSSPFSCSSVHEKGLDDLIEFISGKLKQVILSEANTLITRKRYRDHLIDCIDFLHRANRHQEYDQEIRSEELRHASEMLGKITGVIDVEDLLDVIFSEFCIGK